MRKGARKPDVSTAEALKRALLDAKSVGYTNPAGGGLTAAPIIAMIEKFGITAQMAPKTKLAAGGPTGRVSALGGEWRSRDRHADGLGAVVEPGARSDRHAAGGAATDHGLFGRRHGQRQGAGAARALMRFLATPEAAVVYKAKGLGL